MPEWPSVCVPLSVSGFIVCEGAGAFVVVDVVVMRVQLLSSLPSVQSRSPSHCHVLCAKKCVRERECTGKQND